MTLFEVITVLNLVILLWMVYTTSGGIGAINHLGDILETLWDDFQKRGDK